MLVRALRNAMRFMALGNAWMLATFAAKIGRMKERSWSAFDRQCMARALEISARGLGHTSPNPMVGAVIARDGVILSEGYHARCGEAHAEVMALRLARQRGIDLAGATMYVTLEPCTHTGKTPPCCTAIMGTAISRVVIATLDPNPKVNGGSVSRLEGAGKTVDVGLFEREAQELNRRFFTFQKRRRPYIILKWAESADGFIDSRRSATEPAPWLSNNRCRLLVHKWRAEEGAILVGTNTLLRDNPSLTTRHWHGANPLRIAIDQELSIPEGAQLLDGQAPTLLVYEESEERRARSLELVGKVEGLELVGMDFTGDVATAIVEEVYRRGIDSLIVEGGAQLLQSFMEVGLWDEARVFIGPRELGDGTPGPGLPDGLIGGWEVGDTLLYYFRNSSL